MQARVRSLVTSLGRTLDQNFRSCFTEVRNPHGRYMGRTIPRVAGAEKAMEGFVEALNREALQPLLQEVESLEGLQVSWGDQGVASFLSLLKEVASDIHSLFIRIAEMQRAQRAK